MRSTLSRHLRTCLLTGGALAAALAAGILLPPSTSRAEEQPRLLPPPAMEAGQPRGLQTVVLAGGCFWGVQGVFQHVRGVEDAVSGYAGGAKATADYETVSTGTTGHAESVRVTY